MASDRRQLRNRPIDRADNLATSPGSVDVDPGRFFTAADRAEIVASGKLPALIERARAAEAAARSVRLWFESLDEAPSRACPVCGRPILGRSDRRYCSGACRQRAHRSRNEP